ncbi:hypothetical protein [Paracoccus onubensis]|uniref:hypothetical protein n=1 Tax=Paracoccus onubensis TaxID=1675788 RepID=UPI0011C41E22|nr:hypothetical protein [Paracoccus onubensis]
MTAASPSATFVGRAASTMLWLRTANATFPKADIHKAVLATVDAALYTEVDEAQEADFAKSR